MTDISIAGVSSSARALESNIRVLADGIRVARVAGAFVDSLAGHSVACPSCFAGACTRTNSVLAVGVRVASTIISQTLVYIIASLYPGPSVSLEPWFALTLVCSLQVSAVGIDITVLSGHCAFVKVLAASSVAAVAVDTGTLVPSSGVCAVCAGVAVVLACLAFVHVLAGATVTCETWFTRAAVTPNMILACCMLMTLIAKLAFIDISAIKSIALESIKTSTSKGSGCISASGLVTARIVLTFIDLHAGLPVAEVTFLASTFVSPIKVVAFRVRIANVRLGAFIHVAALANYSRALVS